MATSSPVNIRKLNRNNAKPISAGPRSSGTPNSDAAPSVGGTAPIALVSRLNAKPAGIATTRPCTMPISTKAITLPTIIVVGFIVVRIISVTRFSFSSTTIFAGR